MVQLDSEDLVHGSSILKYESGRCANADQHNPVMPHLCIAPHLYHQRWHSLCRSVVMSSLVFAATIVVHTISPLRQMALLSNIS